MAAHSDWGRSALPSFLNYLRNCPSESLQGFYDEFMKTSGCQTSLRKLYQLLHHHHSRCLPDDVVIAIVATLCDKSLPLIVQKVCLCILQESLPNNVIRLKDLEQLEAMTNISPNLLELFTAIHNKKEGEQEFGVLREKLIRCITPGHHSHIDIKLRALQVILQLAQSSSCPFLCDEAQSLAQSLKSFLGSRMVSQPLRNIMRKDNWMGTTNIDGLPVSQITTVLDLVNSPSGDDDLSLYTFSALHQLWPSIFRKGYMLQPVKQELAKKMVEYCGRVLEQVEQSPLKSLDANLQQAVLIESLLLMNDACQCDSTQVARVIPNIRRIHDRASLPEVILPALRLLLAQGQHVGYDPSSELENFFQCVIVKASNNLCSSCEVILFLKDHLEDFNSMVSVPLQCWFPNILKLVAWFPITFISEFVDLLPTFMSPTTAIEMLHSLLDLPCLTAAMLCTNEEELQSRSDVQQQLDCKAMLTFILRQKSGSGDTLDRLYLLHSFLQDMKDHPRVQAAADIVPTLLKVYFDVIDDNVDVDVTSQLLPVMLDRLSTLYPVPGHSDNIHRIFSEEILRIFQKHPQLACEAKQQIENFLCSAKDPSLSLCANLIWAIGQYASSTFCGNVTFEVIHGYYDVLECMMYEHLSKSSPRTVSIIAATLVKLASRYQDLVPRVLLCLSKVDQYAKSKGLTEWSPVSSRVEEFMALLGEPNIAFVILSPSPDMLSGRYHRDCATLPVLWRATSALTQSPLLGTKTSDQET